MANQQGANAYSEGYFYGILDIYVALMTGADGPSTKPTYGSYQVMGKTIEAQITPNYKEGKVYASNTATRSEKRVDSYTVSLNLDKIPYAIREIILGRYKDQNGVQIVKGKYYGGMIPFPEERRAQLEATYLLTPTGRVSFAALSPHGPSQVGRQ